MLGLNTPGLPRLAVRVRRAQAQARPHPGAGGGRRRAGRHQHHAPQPPGRRGAGGRRHPRADRLRHPPPRGELRRGQPASTSCSSTRTGRALLAGGQELPPAPRRDAGRVPRLRRRPLARSTCASSTAMVAAGRPRRDAVRGPAHRLRRLRGLRRPRPGLCRRAWTRPPTRASRCWSTPARSLGRPCGSPAACPGATPRDGASWRNKQGSGRPLMGGIFNIAFRIVSTLLGLLLVCMGGVWVLQGLQHRLQGRLHGRRQAVGRLGRAGDAGRHRPDRLEQHPARQSLGHTRTSRPGAECRPGDRTHWYSRCLRIRCLGWYAPRAFLSQVTSPPARPARSIASPASRLGCLGRRWPAARSHRAADRREARQHRAQPAGSGRRGRVRGHRQGQRL